MISGPGMCPCNRLLQSCVELRRLRLETDSELREFEAGCFTPSGLIGISIPRIIESLGEFWSQLWAKLHAVRLKEDSQMVRIHEMRFSRKINLSEKVLPRKTKPCFSEGFWRV
jgi:hypothetical protein